MNQPSKAPRSDSMTAAHAEDVTVAHDALVAFTADVFADRGVPAPRARTAAEALVHGDLTGLTSHGLANLPRLYLPALDGAVSTRAPNRRRSPTPAPPSSSTVAVHWACGRRPRPWNWPRTAPSRPASPW